MTSWEIPVQYTDKLLILIIIMYNNIIIFTVEYA